jgi:hypothetical protein
MQSHAHQSTSCRLTPHQQQQRYCYQTLLLLPLLPSLCLQRLHHQQLAAAAAVVS